jgi:hypothetical protein
LLDLSKRIDFLPEFLGRTGSIVKTPSSRLSTQSSKLSLKLFNGLADFVNVACGFFGPRGLYLDLDGWDAPHLALNRGELLAKLCEVSSNNKKKIRRELSHYASSS